MDLNFDSYEDYDRHLDSNLMTSALFKGGNS